MNLTNYELKVLEDTAYLKLKNQLNKKIISQFSDIETELRGKISEANFSFPKATFTKTGKISKGEQYEGLPYFTLDYPRKFTKDEVFAIRLMLWWGNEFSYTLHLQGSFLEAKQEQILSRVFEDKDLYYCINQSPWEYHFRDTNYIQVKNLSKTDLSEQIAKNGFIKISDRLPIKQSSELKSFSRKNFARFLMLCA